MENINISLGIELDKKQFNDNYIQGQVDKAASNISVKVNNVKIKDVSKSIQNDLDKQVGNLDVQIKGVSLDETEIKSTVNRISDFIQKSLNSLPKEHMFKFTTDNGMLDVKQLQKEITNGIKNAINESMDLAEIDFDKLSVTGGKKIANSIGDILQAESVASNIKEEVSKINNELDKVSDKKVEIEAEVDDKYREGIESIKRDIESLSSDLLLFGVSDSKSLSEYENKINDIFKRINEIGKLNIDIDFSELEEIYNEFDKIRDKIDNEFQKSLQVDKDDELEWLSDNIKSVEDDIQKLEVALSKINLADGISDDDKILELKNKINSLSDELEIFYNEDITKSFNQDINDMILRLEDLKTVLDSVNNSKIKEEQMHSSNEKKSKDGLNLEISDVIIIDEEKIVSSLQNSLDSISKRLSVLVEHIKLSSDNSGIVDTTNLELSNISGKLNPLEVGVAITDEFKAAILSDIELLFNQVEPILEKLENKFKVTTSKIEQYFGTVITKITNDLSYLLSENIKFDFTKSKLIGLDDKLNSIREKLTLQINDIDLGELAYKNEEIQTQLNVFTSEVALEIKNIKLLNVVEEIQTKLDDIGKDLEITVKNVNIDSNKSVSDDNRGTNNTSTVIDKPITSKELKSQISKMKEYNDELSKITKTSVTFVDNERKSVSQTTEGLGKTTTSTTKFNVDGSITEIDKIVNNTKAFNKEIDNIRNKIENLNNTDADTIGKISEQLNNFKIGDSIDEFERLKREVEELSKLDKNIDNVRETISKLNAELRDSKIEGYFDKSVFKEIQKSINSITTDSTEEEIKSVSDRIKELSKTKNDIVNINKTIDDLSRSLTKLKSGTGNDKLSLTENSSSVGAMTRNINSLVKMRDKLVSGEFLGSKVEQSIVAANNRMKDLQVTISATTKNINELQKQKGISENVFIKQEDLINKLKKLYSDGFIDDGQFKKLQNKINNINTDKLKSEVKSIENEFANLAKNGKQLNNVTKAINKITKDVDNVVSENIKFIDSDKAISEVNSLMSKLNELNIIRDKLSNGELVGNKAINEAISGVKKVADTYTQTLSNLSSNQKIFDNISKNLDNATTNKAVLGLDDSYVNKLRDELNNIDLSSNEAQTSLKELESTVKRIGNSDKDIQKLKGVIQQLEGNISKISDKQKFSIVTESDINKMNEMKSHVDSLNNVIDKLNNGIEVTQIEIRDLEATSKNSMENISSVTESASDSFSDLGVSLNRAMEFAIGDSISGILEEQVRMAGQTILDIDDKLRDLKRVTKLSAEEYKEFTKSSNEAAISIGRSTAEAIEATTSFVKLGYSVEEAKGYLSEAGLTLANVADMNTEDSIDAITSTLKGFGFEVQEVTRVIDVMNESGNKFALSTSDLAEMLRIGSASMSIAGNDLEQTSALMISAFEILQDSSKVANGLKTISMRLRGVAEEGEELNPKLGELVKTLTGVDLTDANGEFRNTYEVLSEIGQVFDTLGSKEQALLLEQLAGKNQVLKASYVEKSA